MPIKLKKLSFFQANIYSWNSIFHYKVIFAFDYIFVMDSSNYDNVIALAETHEHKQKVKLIMNELTPNQNQDVPDPYFGMHNGFDIVYKMLSDACEVIAQKLIAKHQ